jgi:hypothetical protein
MVCWDVHMSGTDTCRILREYDSRLRPRALHHGKFPFTSFKHRSNDRILVGLRHIPRALATDFIEDQAPLTSNSTYFDETVA